MTFDEKYQIYLEVKHEFYKRDIKNHAEGREYDMSDNKLDGLADNLDEELDDCDMYWDSYSESIENVLDEQM